MALLLTSGMALIGLKALLSEVYECILYIIVICLDLRAIPQNIPLRIVLVLETVSEGTNLYRSSIEILTPREHGDLRCHMSRSIEMYCFGIVLVWFCYALNAGRYIHNIINASTRWHM